MSTKLNAKEIFNALSNADHIFSFEQNKTPITILHLVAQEDTAKAVVRTADGELKGLYTDATSAVNALKEVVAVFGDDQPELLVKTRVAGKNERTVYYFEVQ